MPLRRHHCPFIQPGLVSLQTFFYRFKEYLLSRGYFEDAPLTLSFWASIVCGVIVVCIETPLDVANTRLYNQGNDPAWCSVVGRSCMLRLFRLVNYAFNVLRSFSFWVF